MNIDKFFLSVSTLRIFPFLSLLVLMPYGLKAQDASTKGAFISLSDIHFNPTADPSIGQKLAASPYTAWEAVFETALRKDSSLSAQGGDINYALLKSMLKSVKSTVDTAAVKPDFILINGDFLAHDFQTYGDHDSFIAKTVNFIAGLFDARFGNRMVVLPVLGNNDSYCGDYCIAPNDPFLTMFAKAWVRLQRKTPPEDSLFIALFSRGGYYSYSYAPQGRQPLKIILLNTVFLSNSYMNYCPSCQIGTVCDPGTAELDWLQNGELADTLKTSTPVWLVQHVPVGIDVYNAIKNNAASMLLRNCTPGGDFNRRYVDLLADKKYSKRIRAAFAGHTHKDEFRIVRDTFGAPSSFMHVTPSVSSYFSNNPTFQYLTYNSTSYLLLDTKTYFLNLNDYTGSLGADNPAWTFEYDFADAFKVKAPITPTTLQTVADNIRTNKDSSQFYYLKFFNAGSNNGKCKIKSGTQKFYLCGLANQTASSYNKCLSSKGSKSRRRRARP